MPKATAALRHLRFEAKMSQAKLARYADIDRNTLANAESGKQVSEMSIVKIKSALSTALDREISEAEIIQN